MSDKLKKGEHNKISRCLDEMSAVDTYDERYVILRAFSLGSYQAGAHMALDEFAENLKESIAPHAGS